MRSQVSEAFPAEHFQQLVAGTGSGGVTEAKVTRVGWRPRAQGWPFMPLGTGEHDLRSPPHLLPAPPPCRPPEVCAAFPPFRSPETACQDTESQQGACRHAGAGWGPCAPSAAALLLSPCRSPLLAGHTPAIASSASLEPPESRRRIHLDLPGSQEKAPHK